MEKRKLITQNAAQATILLGLAATISKVLGLLRDILLAKYFGATYLTDALNNSQIIPMFISAIITAALVVVYLPIFNEEKSENEKIAYKNFNNIFTWTAVSLFILYIFFTFTASFWVNTLAPGFPLEIKKITEFLMALVFPGFIFLALASLLLMVLQSFKLFLVASFIPLLQNLGVVGSLLFFSQESNIEIYTYGLIIGNFLQLLVLCLYIRKYLGLKLKPDFTLKDPTFLKVLKLMLPLLFLSFFSTLMNAINQNLASHIGEGNISAYGYANRLMQFPLGIVAIPLATAFYPFMADAVKTNNIQDIKLTFRKSLKFAQFLIIPIITFLVVFSFDVVTVLFKRGVFDDNAVKLTQLSLAFLSIGLFGLTGNTITNRMLYAFKDTWTPVKILTISTLINVLLVFPLTRYIKISGIALSSSIAAIFSFYFIAQELRKKIGLVGGKEILKQGVKTFIASLTSAFISYGLMYVLKTQLGTRGFVYILEILFTGSFFLLIYFGASLLLKVKEATQILKILKIKSEKEFIKDEV